MSTSPEFQFPQYDPVPWLKNGHLMTIVPALVPRKFPQTILQAETRVFEVEPGNRILARCNWQPTNRSAVSATMIIVHGLEGSSEARYVLGIAHKAFASGMNVLRLNLRNCGDTLHMSETLYHGGMSSDLIAVMEELQRVDDLSSFALMGFSLGGNIVLKAAAELSRMEETFLKTVAAISPALDLHTCVNAIQRPENRLYEQFFVRALKKKIRQKAALQPDRFNVINLDAVKGLKQFDDQYTAVHGGFGTAENYYATQSSLNVLGEISMPALIISSQDDPMVPFPIFANSVFDNPNITLLTPRHGGHSGFLARKSEDSLFDQHWAENRVVQFCKQHCRTSAAAGQAEI